MGGQITDLSQRNAYAVGVICSRTNMSSLDVIATAPARNQYAPCSEVRKAKNIVAIDASVLPSSKTLRFNIIECSQF